MKPGLLVAAAGFVLGGCSPFVYHSPEATAELRNAMEAANAARVDGPARVKLAARTDLLVQAGLVFIPPREAERLLRAIGERPTKEMLGLMIHATPERADRAILYSKNRPQAALPEIEFSGWQEAPGLWALRHK